MKKILVTTDFSKESEIAFEAAKQLAEKFASQILLLSVVQDPGQLVMSYGADPMIFPYPAMLKDILSKVKADLEAVKNKHFQGQRCEAYVEDAIASIDSKIVEFAQQQKVDLLVIASHGRSGLGRLLIGSVAERVVRHAPCPVLVVPVRRT